MFNSTIKNKLYLVGFLSLSFFALLIILSSNNLKLAQEAYWWVDHTHEVIRKSTTIEKLIVDMETGQRGFLISGDEEFLEPYNGGLKLLPSLLKETKELVSDNPPQVEKIINVEKSINKWNETAGAFEINLKRRVNKGETPQSEVIRAIRSKHGKSLMDSIRLKLKRFKDTEANLMAERGKSSKLAFNTTKNILLYGYVLAVALSLFVFSRTSRKIYKPILELASKGQEISFSAEEEEILLPFF